MKEKQESILKARQLLRAQELGVLSTHSKAMRGFPFGSVTTYVTTVNGEPVFYISDLAQHTKNIQQNSRVCFTVYSGDKKDPNAGARLSLLGTAEHIGDTDLSTLEERYFSLFPESRQYQNMHDFNFFILKCERVRYIGGFGEIYWFNSSDWLLNTPDWLESEYSMIEHMNHDHKDALQLMCKHQHDIDAKEIELLCINPDGFFIRADNLKPKLISFEKIASNGNDVRQQMVQLTHNARQDLDRVDKVG